MAQANILWGNQVFHYYSYTGIQHYYKDTLRNLPTEVQETRLLSTREVSFYPFIPPPHSKTNHWIPGIQVEAESDGGRMAQANRDANAHVDFLPYQGGKRS